MLHTVVPSVQNCASLWYLTLHSLLLQVFSIDFGDIFVVSSSHIRILKDEFLNLPFQAVECFLNGEQSFTLTARLVESLKIKTSHLHITLNISGEQNLKLLLKFLFSIILQFTVVIQM